MKYTGKYKTAGAFEFSLFFYPNGALIYRISGMCVFYKNYAIGLYLLHNFKKSIHKIYACKNLIHNLLNQISNYIKLFRKF